MPGGTPTARHGHRIDNHELAARPGISGGPPQQDTPPAVGHRRRPAVQRHHPGTRQRCRAPRNARHRLIGLPIDFLLLRKTTKGRHTCRPFVGLTLHSWAGTGSVLGFRSHGYLPHGPNHLLPIHRTLWPGSFQPGQTQAGERGRGSALRNQEDVACYYSGSIPRTGICGCYSRLVDGPTMPVIT